MLAGPIFRWEMTAAGRRSRYFLVRIAYAVVLLLVLWSVYESTLRYVRGGRQGSIQQAAEAAWQFFYAYSWVQLLAVVAIVPALAVGSISTERERRTIEYLFATDLSNAEIVLGKIGARLLLTGKFLLTGLPILLLFRLLGGIPMELVVAGAILSASTAILLTALATCVSVWSKRSRDATIRVYLILAVLTTLVPMLSVWWNMVLGRQLRAHYLSVALAWLTELNPLQVLGQALNLGGVGLDAQVVYATAGWHLAIAAGLTGLATAAVRRVHLREIAAGAAAAARRRLLPRLPRWRPAVGDRPMIWKEAFAGSAKTRLGVVGNVAAGVVGFSVVGFTVYALIESMGRSNWSSGRPAWRPFVEYLAVLTGWLGTGLVLLAGARGAGLVTYEKERDCWISLLSTPMSGPEIVWGKVVGNLYSLRGGVYLLGAAWALGVFLTPSFLFPALLSAGTLTLAALFASLLGIAYSLRSPTTLRATGYALATLLFVGGGYMFCCCMLTMGGGGSGAEIILAACIPFLIVFPMIAYASAGSMMFDFTDGAMPAAFILGVVGYAIAVGMLHVTTAGEFERLAGRNTGMPDEVRQSPLQRPATPQG
ncbi:MAG: ABC transporter permease subunit [Pirellulales bacterium]|nr:ABC transporter permease subunit [Pirellulales bacterium]